MKRVSLVALLLAGILMAPLVVTIASNTLGMSNDTLRIENPSGELIKTIDADGLISETLNPGDLLLPYYHAWVGINRFPDARSAPRTEIVHHEEPGAGLFVDENGEIRPLPGTDPSTFNARAQTWIGQHAGETLQGSLTIDSMTTRGFSSSYQVGGGVGLIGSADTYYLSDGSSWSSGAGSYRASYGTLDHVEIDGDTIRYVLSPPADGILYQQTDFNADSHSAQGTLAVAGPLVIEATIGSTTAIMTGQAEILSNEMTWYGEPRFNFYSTVVGAVVPFEITYTLGNTTWTPGLFDSPFGYSSAGWVDFASPLSVPGVVNLRIIGSSQVPDDASIQYTAVVTYDNDVQANITHEAVWSVQPNTFATIDAGLLVLQSLDNDEELTIHAEYTGGEVFVEADKAVTCIADASADLPDAWEMYQSDSRHTGYVPIGLEPDVFSLRWQRMVGAGLSLNPVTAADGKVFVSLDARFNSTPSLFVLDARDGETLWSKSFGSVFSVNPPSYAYGNVYIQTGNHGSDTYLHSYEAETGDLVFKSPHAAQWEHYYAPTIVDGTVYVNGGTYGGMYAFDAFAGTQRWFHSLPQYDEWTPAVDSSLAYAYVGEYNPGLYVVDRLTGESEFMIPDLNFDWNGWSMRIAPVLGDLSDVIAIHDGRLISFDLESRTIGWELARDFRGQPSVADGFIYAIDGRRVVVLDEQTGAESWSWEPPQGQPAGTLIVTDTHVFVSTESDVYAIEILSRSEVWNFPASGHLAWVRNDSTSHPRTGC